MFTRNTGNAAGIFEDEAAMVLAGSKNNRRLELYDGSRYQTSNVDEGSGVLLSTGNYANPRSGQGIAEAPIDGTPYVRQDAGWIPESTTTNPIIRQSLLDNPLLHILKTNKIADTLAGPLTWTRATTATYVDRYGVVQTAAIDEPRQEAAGWLIEGASTNNCLQSESFASATWSPSGITVSNSGTAPDGVSPSEKILEDNTLAVHSNIQFDIVTLALEKRTASVFVKAVERDSIRLQVNDASGTKFPISYFNLSTLVVSLSSDIDKSFIIPLANGWLLCGFEFTTVDAGNSVLTVGLADGNDTASYQGVTGSGVEVWGANNKDGPMSSYIPTTTVAVTREADFISSGQYNNLSDLNKDWSVIFTVDLLNIVSSSRRVIGTSDNEFLIQISEVGQVIVGGQNPGVFTSSPLSSKKAFIVVVNEAGTQFIYIDGIKDAVTGGLVFLQDADGATIEVGRLGTTALLNGHIKDLRTYDFALNPDEVKLLGGG